MVTKITNNDQTNDRRMVVIALADKKKWLDIINKN